MTQITIICVVIFVANVTVRGRVWYKLLGPARLIPLEIVHQVHRLDRLSGPGWLCQGGNVREMYEQLLYRNMQRFRGGLVFKAHRLCITQP